jgi:hypothetical protein
MADAIRSVGLEPDAVGVHDHFSLKSTLYGYLRGRVPVLMGLWLYDVSGPQPKRMGKHAIAVTGFRLGTQVDPSQNPFGFQSVACQINRVYAHDDGVGPFARMVFDGGTVAETINGQQVALLSLSTAWKTEAGVSGCVRAVPEILLVPLYHKIRIPLDRVQGVLLQFDLLLEGWRQEQLLPLDARLQWDVFLSTVNQFKESVFCSSTLSGDDRLSVLSRPLPRFMWRATARLGEQPLFDLLFDATDIEQGQCFAQAVVYDPKLAAAIRAIGSQPETEAALRHLPVWTILKHFTAV